MKIFSILGLLTACSTELPQKLTEDSAVDDVEGQEPQETDTEDTNSSDTTDTNSDDDTSDDGRGLHVFDTHILLGCCTDCAHFRCKRPIMGGES